jgi:dihydroorotate dehydrogenase electron transfer subunit
MNKIQGQYKIVSNEKVCPQYYRLCVDAGILAKRTQPGQFIHVRVKEGLEPFLRRPFSVHRAKKHVEILYDVVGKGTSALSQRKAGETLDVLGPLGNSFCAPPAGIKEVVMIAGGIGLAPFLFLCDVLKKKKFRMKLLYGGRTKKHIYGVKEFKQNGCEVFVATEDGSRGTKGFVSKLFDSIPTQAATTFIYNCGPLPMMAAVQEFAKARHLKGQASCEERMACGLGACLGCVVKTTSGYKTACYDGPVFDLEEIIFGNGK